jgi:hypothetical protein
MSGNTERQVKDIESRKRLQELAGIHIPSSNIEAEKLWEDLQLELTKFLDLVKAN